MADKNNVLTKFIDYMRKDLAQFLGHSSPCLHQTSSREEKSAPVSNGHFEHPLLQDISLSLNQLSADWHEKQNQVESLRNEVDRLKEKGNALLDDHVNAAKREIVSQAAMPALMLLTQQHLHDQGKPADAADIFTLANEIIQVLKDNGLVLIGTPGQTMPFNPAQHDLPDNNTTIQESQPVTIVSPGAMFQNYVIQRARVKASK